MQASRCSRSGALRATIRQTSTACVVHRPCCQRAKAVSVRASFQPQSVGLNPELKESIDTVISNNKVVVFMKGTPQFPQCGFSNTVCQILRSMNVPFEGVNILADERLRSGMKEYSQWPTFPQVYVAGEFVGGADILIPYPQVLHANIGSHTEMYQSGELVELFERELNS